MHIKGKLARLLAGTLHFFHLHKGTFHSGTFSHALVSRFYKLYVPRNYSGSAPLCSWYYTYVRSTPIISWRLVCADFTVAAVIGRQAVFSRSISAEDILLFAQVSGDHNPIHMDAEYAER